MQQFGRQIKLYLGNAQESIECSALRITFEASKTITPEPNPAKISVYNLNENNRNRIMSGEFDKVILMAGYNELRTVFAGDIVDKYERRNATDTILNLECGDGAYDITNARINAVLSGGANDASIVDKSLATMTKTELGAVILPLNNHLPRGRVLVGNTRDIMGKIARSNHADWFVHDGSLVVLPKDQHLGEEGFVISKDSGMVGSPEKTKDGVKVTCLLNTGLIIGGLVKVKSILKSFNGVYKITEIKHKGDIIANVWHTEFIGIGGEFKKANG